MKKLLIFLLVTVLALGLGAAACGTEPIEPTINASETAAQFLPLTVYLPNDNADGFITKDAIFDGKAQSIVSLLVAEGALPAGCALLSFEDGVADMNAAYGGAISNTGTAGEYLMIGCVVNSLLIAYELESVYLTIEGAVPETGHEIYDYPLKFYENQVAQ